MMPTKLRWLKRLLAFSIFATLLVAGSCMAREMTVDVVVFNYTTKPMAEITIQGKYMGGWYQKYGPGGTGGKIYCCIDVKPGAASVEWEYDCPPAAPTPPEGFKRDVVGFIPKLGKDYKYLGVHIYRDEKVEFTLTGDIPPEKKEGGP